MDQTKKTSNDNHAEYLRQAYGFEVDLLEEKIVYPVGVEDLDFSGWSTFHHAAAANDTEILEDIINQEGFNHLESRTDKTDGHHFTPLLCAVKGNAVDTFNILVSNGGDIAARDINGLGIVEIAVMFASIDVFEHLLVNRYELKELDVWQGLLTLLYKRESDEEGANTRNSAIEMADILMNKETRYVECFLQRGGLGSIRDLLQERVDQVKVGDKEQTETSKLQNIIKEEEKERKDVLYVRTLKTLQGILQRTTVDQGKMLSAIFQDIILILLQIMDKGSKEGFEAYQESQLAGDCLELIAGSAGWGVASLEKTCAITNLLRSILLHPDSLLQLQIIKAAFSKDRKVLLDSMSRSEIEVMLCILKTEKRVHVKKFFISLLKDLFRSERSKHHLYNEGLIEALLSGLGGPDTDSDTITLELLLLISATDAGVQAIFKSTNSFIYLVNRVRLETENRFDVCIKLLWKLVQNFSNLQDSVKLIENIGITTVIRMLDSSDSEITCIGCEAVKILLNSDKYDYRAKLVRREVHTKLVILLADSNEGHVLFCVMTSLASLAVSWSSLHPIPAVQNAVLQHDCLSKTIQTARASRFTSSNLQSAAFLLIAATLLGNPVTEKRLAEHDIDIEGELLMQTKHNDQSLQNAIKATSMFRYHALLMDNDHFKFRSRFETDTKDSLFNVILGRTIAGESTESQVIKMLDNPDEGVYIYIATLGKLKRCADAVVRHGVETLIKALYEGTPRIQEAAATALASVSYCKTGIEQLLIESHEDPDLLVEVSRLSANVPVSKKLENEVQSNSVVEHRRRVLKKNSSYIPKLPDIGRKVVTTKSGATSPSRPKDGAKSPVIGDKLLSKIETVEYGDITRLGLTRPYSKVATLPKLLVEQGTGFKSRDPKLYTTVDRIYRKLYLRPATIEAESRPQTTNVKNNQHNLARSLSFVF